MPVHSWLPVSLRGPSGSLRCPGPSRLYPVVARPSVAKSPRLVTPEPWSSAGGLHGAQELSHPSSWARLGQPLQAASGSPEPRMLPVWPGRSAGSLLQVRVTPQEGLGCGLDMALLNVLKEWSCVAQTETHARLLLVGAAHGPVPYRRCRR